MRRRLGFLSTLAALVLVLALPATTFASSFTYAVQKDTCSASGGNNGYGHLYFKVKLTELGNSGANKFTFSAKAQHRELGGTRWYTEWNYGTDTYTFLDNGANHSRSMWYTADPDDFAWHRIKVTMKVWHGGILLAQRTVYSRKC